MKISNATDYKDAEKTIELKSAKPGDVVRFAGTRFEDAIRGAEDSDDFFMVVAKQPASTDRVTLISLDRAVVLERDADRLVIRHDAEIAIKPNL